MTIPNLINIQKVILSKNNKINMLICFKNKVSCLIISTRNIIVKCKLMIMNSNLTKNNIYKRNKNS